MDNVDLNVLRQIVAWREAGQHVVMGTVTRTWGSAPRPVGSVGRARRRANCRLGLGRLH